MSVEPTHGPVNEGSTLRLSPVVVAPSDPREIVFVLDTTWTRTDPGPVGLVGLRDVAERVLARRDMIPEASALLDPWVEDVGVVDLMSHGGVSFWYGARLRHWLWLAEQILWLAVLDEVLGDIGDVARIVVGVGADPELAEAAQMIGARDGLTVEVESGGRAADPASVDDVALHASGEAPSAMTPDLADRSSKGSGSRGRRGRGSLWRRLTRPFRTRARPRRLETLNLRRAVMRDRLEAIVADPSRRLLVVQAHVRQRIDTPAGPRSINVYLSPIMERLRGTALEPFEVDIRSGVEDERAWSRLQAVASDRTLSRDVLDMLSPSGSASPSVSAAVTAADRIAATTRPLAVAGVDLGPRLAHRIAARLSQTWWRDIADVERIRALLRRTHPAGILLADEYHRQDWLAAARAEGLPVSAVQHGVIYRWHTGYIHRSRPASLALPDRTYVFGSWERELLTTSSVYHPDEVVVGGSPRLDLVTSMPDDRARLREALGVAGDDRLIVLSGTWGRLYRRFQYPIALARLFDRPIDRVHVVVKLHPAERDEGPYRRIIDGVAAARGFIPPRVTSVQEIDLYRLLSAADAHLGIHSTLLTEAVVTGTPNLLVTGLAGADLLGFVEAGVAIPVCDGADLAEALDRPREQAMPPAEREAFLRRHFEPGSASTTIAEDLLAWLT